MIARAQVTIEDRRLWEVYDGESYYIMAPTSAEALALWWKDCADGHEEDDPPAVTDITDKAKSMAIRSDDDAGGPAKSAQLWMDECEGYTAIIGASVW